MMDYIMSCSVRFCILAVFITIYIEDCIIEDSIVLSLLLSFSAIH